MRSLVLPPVFVFCRAACSPVLGAVVRLLLRLSQAHTAIAGRWSVRLRGVLAVACVATFIGLTWVRAESLAVMMPGAVNLGLGVVTGLLGHSLGYWVAALGMAPTRACVVAQFLKLAQIVGVPTGYLLLGGHMLALPLLGAGLALAAVGWAHRRGLSCARRATPENAQSLPAGK